MKSIQVLPPAERHSVQLLWTDQAGTILVGPHWLAVAAWGFRPTAAGGISAWPMTLTDLMDTNHTTEAERWIAIQRNEHGRGRLLVLEGTR